MQKFLIIILPLLSNCCSMNSILYIDLINSEYAIYGSTQERNTWDIQEYFMNGELMTYSLNGDYGLHFQLEQPVHAVDQEAHYSQSKDYANLVSENMNGFDVLRESQSKFWLNQFAFLDGNQIYRTLEQNLKNVSPQFTDRIEIGLQDGMQCIDLKYLDENTFIICCTNQDFYQLITISHSVRIDQKVMPLLQSDAEVHIQIQRNGQSIFLFVALFHHEFSSIETYKINFDYQISALIDTINIERLNIFFMKKMKQFHLVQFQTGYTPYTYILDQNIGLMRMEINSEGKWNYLFQYTFKDISQYESFNILNLYGNIENLKILGENTLGQHLICSDNNSCQLYNLINNQRYQIYITQHYQILCTFDYLFIYQETNLIFQKKLTNYRILVNQFTDQFIIFQYAKSQLFGIHQGKLIQNPTQVKQIQIKQFNLIGISKNGECVCQIKYQIHDFRDSRIQQSIQDQTDNQLIIFYPQYPEISIIMETEVVGPQIEVKSVIDFGITPKISYLYGYKIQGMEQIETENIIYYNILQSKYDYFHYHLIQIDDYSVHIYQCQKQNELENDLLCSNQYFFQLTYQITKNSMCWTNSYDFIYGMHFAYYFQQLHQISIYSLIAKTKSLVYTIKTSIQDESNQITQFIIINQYIYIFLKQLKLIQIHSIKTRQLILYINEEFMNQQGVFDWNPSQIFADNIQNPELLFIRNEDNLLIGYFFNKFTLIQTIPLLNAYCEVDLAIFQKTIVIIQLYSNQAIIQEYSIIDFNTIVFKKNYPIYSNILQQPLSLYYNNLQSIFYVCAFSQVQQQTVFLVYSTLQSLRQSLLTTIQTGEYIPITDGKIMFAVGGFNEIYLKIPKQVKRLIQYASPRMTMNPPNVSHDLYKVDGIMKKTYSNQDYPLTIDLNQKIQFINLQTALQWLPLSQIYIDNKNLIQYILIKDRQIIGQWINQLVQCVQCGSSKSDLVHLIDKLEIINRESFDFAIRDMIVMEYQVVILKSKQIIMLNDKSKFTIESKIENYSAQRMYYFDELLIIVLEKYGEGTLLQFYGVEGQLKYLGYQLLQEVKVLKIIKYQKYLIILHCKNLINYICTKSSAIIYLYLIIGDELNYLELKYTMDAKYFSKEYILNDIILTEKLILLATECNYGLLAIQLKYINNILQPETPVKLIDINQQLIKSNLNLIKNDCYLSIIRIRENQYILTTILNNAYGIVLDPEIQIIFIVLKYGMYQRSSQIQYANNKLILSYIDGNNFIFCLYEIPDGIQISKDQSFIPIICKGGLSFINKNDQNKIMFPLLHQHNELTLYLAEIMQNDRQSQLSQYKLNEEATIIINNVTEFNEKQTLELVVSNSFEQSVQKIQIKKQIQPIPEKSLLMEYIWLLLIFVILLILILMILVCTKCRKKVRRKRKSKTISLKLN